MDYLREKEFAKLLFVSVCLSLFKTIDDVHENKLQPAIQSYKTKERGMVWEKTYFCISVKCVALQKDKNSFFACQPPSENSG